MGKQRQHVGLYNYKGWERHCTGATCWCKKPRYRWTPEIGLWRRISTYRTFYGIPLDPMYLRPAP
jgi:hypothetical protein